MRFGFELTYNDIAVQHINYCTTEAPLFIVEFSFFFFFFDFRKFFEHDTFKSVESIYLTHYSVIHYLLLMNIPVFFYTHTHTHTHTYIYIYIYWQHFLFSIMFDCIRQTLCISLFYKRSVRVFVCIVWHQERMNWKRRHIFPEFIRTQLESSSGEWTFWINFIHISNDSFEDSNNEIVIY